MPKSAEKIIKSSLRVIGCLGTGETMEAAEAQDALEALNSMLSLWSAEDVMVYTIITDTVTGAVGTASYEMGTGKTWDTTRPTDIKDITLVDGSTEYNLQSLKRGEYLNRKELDNARPTSFWVNPKWDAQEVIFPAPLDSAYSFTIYSLKPLDAFTSLTDTVELPEMYEEAIKWSLAVRLAPEYEKQAPPTVVSLAESSLDIISRQNYTAIEMQADVAVLQSNGGSGDWE